MPATRVRAWGGRTGPDATGGTRRRLKPPPRPVAPSMLLVENRLNRLDDLANRLLKSCVEIASGQPDTDQQRRHHDPAEDFLHPLASATALATRFIPGAHHSPDRSHRRSAPPTTTVLNG